MYCSFVKKIRLVTFFVNKTIKLLFYRSEKLFNMANHLRNIVGIQDCPLNLCLKDNFNNTTAGVPQPFNVGNQNWYLIFLFLHKSLLTCNLNKFNINKNNNNS